MFSVISTKYDFRNNESKIPIIDRRMSTIAGVRVHNFRDLGSNVHAQSKVEAALKKMMPFNFEYKIQKPNSQKEEGSLRLYDDLIDFKYSHSFLFPSSNAQTREDSSRRE